FPMDFLVVNGGCKRQAVGPSADDRHLPRARHTGRLRQLHRVAVELWFTRGVGDLELVVLRNGAHRQPENPLERLGWRLFAFWTVYHFLSQVRLVARRVEHRLSRQLPVGASLVLSSRPHWPRFPASPPRSSAGRIRPPTASRARRTC